jgi:predicted ribosome quality control (RQC) complex YloA/Tae2 family protein
VPGSASGGDGSIQALDLTGLRAVLAELRTSVLPARFEKAQQNSAHSVQLGLRSLAGSRWLELSWLAEAPRLLAIAAPPRLGEGSTLAQQLQHSLRGLALVEIRQDGFERIVELVFARRPGEAGQRSLVLELMGRHSNLFLLDEQRRVISLGRQVRQQQSRLRPIGTGDTYTAPPPPAGDPPRLGESLADWRRRLCLVPLPLRQALMQSYQGVSPALVRQLLWGLEDQRPLATLPVADLDESSWQALWGRWQCWLQTIASESFQLVLGGPSDHCCWPAVAAGLAEPPADQEINRGLASYYEQRLGQRQRQRQHRELQQQLLAAAAREQRELERQQALLNASAGEALLQQRADGLLSLPSPGREQIDEAQKLYRQARRLRRSVAAITPRLVQHQARLTALEASLTFLEQADDLGGLEAIAAELQELLPSRPGGGRPRTRAGRRQGGSGPLPPQPLELRRGGGLRLLVGRNHRQNEWISLRQARRGDLWFHAQELPGSHVVLKGSEGAPDEADLQAAADLAAHFSRGRGNRRVPVVMVPTDDLQRLAGAGPGTVTHRGGAVLWGEPLRALELLQSP